VFSSEDDGICSWLLFIFASLRERRCDVWLIFSGGAEANRLFLVEFDTWLTILVKLSSRTTDEPFSDLLKKKKSIRFYSVG
jgi:hypothetical protein